ncbi:MAG: efflux transporter outer membrane subunit [Opitutales bacterium]
MNLQTQHREVFRLVTRLLAGGSLMLLGACATAPEPSPAPEIDWPAVWSSGAAEALPGPWLADFQDPRLEAHVAEALTHNAELQRIAAVLGQRVAEARIAGADLMPSTDLGLNGSRQQINTFGPTATGGVIFENYDLSLDLSWELDLWGRLRNLTSAALARVELSQAELEAARLSLAARVTKSWFDWTEARQQVSQAERTATAYRENQRTLEERFRRGLTEAVDLRRIRSLAARAESDLAARHRALDSAARNFEILLGRYPSAEVDGPSVFPALPAAVPAGLPAGLIGRRPDLIAAERRLAATEQEFTAERKNLLPRISLTASGGRSSREFQNLLDGDFSVWSLAGNLTQPIFQGGRIRATIDRSASLRQQAAAAYRDTALQAFLEVESTLAAERYLQDQTRQLQLSAEEANAAETLTWERYRKGTGEFIEVLDARRTAANTRSQLIRARNLLLQNRVDLYLALGGPFQTNSE